jgi:hypothetical protein
MMASKKVIITNRSRQRRDILVWRKRPGAEKPSLVTVSISRFKNVEIAREEISPSLDEMLKRPRIFGLHLEDKKSGPPRKKEKIEDTPGEDEEVKEE